MNNPRLKTSDCPNRGVGVGGQWALLCPQCNPGIFHKSVSQQPKHLDLRRHVTFPRLCRRRVMKVSLRRWTEKTLCDVLFDILVRRPE